MEAAAPTIRIMAHMIAAPVAEDPAPPMQGCRPIFLNHKKVREVLAAKGIIIPDTTQFVGSMHDTAADVMAYYDEDVLTTENQNAAHHQHTKF